MTNKNMLLKQFRIVYLLFNRQLVSMNSIIFYAMKMNNKTILFLKLRILFGESCFTIA